jgi:hypothetical protein
MEQITSSEADSSSARQEISRSYMEPKGSLPYIQELATYLYPEPDESSARPLPISWRSILIFCRVQLGLPSGLFLPGPPSPYARLLSAVSATCPAGLSVSVADELLPIPSSGHRIDTKLTWDSLNLCFCYFFSYLRVENPSNELSPVKTLHMLFQQATQQ